MKISYNVFVNENLGPTVFAFNAIAGHDEDKFNEMLDKGADVKYINHEQQNLLYCCLNSQDKINFSLNTYDKLLRLGSNPNIVALSGNFPLILCAVPPIELEIAKLLLEYGAGPNMIDSTVKNTALIKFAVLDDIKGVMLLLEYGADPNITNKFGNNFADENAYRGNNNITHSDEYQDELLSKYPQTFKALEKYLSDDIKEKYCHLKNANDLNLI